MTAQGDQVCLPCGGEGRQVWDEDGVRCLDQCYACLGLGWVGEDVAHDQALGAACDRLGSLRAAAYHRARDEDPEGDGFALCAAESMFSPWEYEQALAMAFADEAMREVASWPLDRQEWLVALSAWGRP